MSSHPEPPYRRIAAELRGRITSGELPPGARVPSTREIAGRWGVAIATATRVVAVLRDEGLVETRSGSGTRVSWAVPAPPEAKRPRRPGRAGGRLDRRTVVRRAVQVADGEGLEAVSMRRLATELGVGPMSLYRHLEHRDDLVAAMADQVLAGSPLPEPGPEGWRAKLELVCRQQWRLFCRHGWLARAVSLSRPLLVPHVLAQTEWTMRALDGHGLTASEVAREALVLPTLAMGIAEIANSEVDAEQRSGVPLDYWRTAQRARISELLGSGTYPHLARLSEGLAADLDGLFAHALDRHLDGVATLIGRAAATSGAVE